MTRQSVLVVFALCVTVAFSTTSKAERYIVTDDAFGNAGAKQISELDAEELEALDAQKSEARNANSPSVEQEAEPALEAAVLQPIAPVQEVITPSQKPVIVNQTSTSDTSQRYEGTVRSDALLGDTLDTESEETSTAKSAALPQDINQKVLGAETPASVLSPIDQVKVKQENPFDRALRESQANETDEVVKRLRAQGGDDRFDATKVNPADFVDSEDLIQGNVNSEGERPFFVTFDGDGDSNVIFYSPQVIQDEIKRREVEEVLSDAVVFTPEDARNSLSLPEGADPVAAQILASGYKKSYFERFTDRCCEGLPNVGVLSLRLDKGLHVPLDRDDFSYRFADGDSRYQLVRLPDVRKNYLLTIKTFVRSYKKLGIDHGAFIPQIVLLDREKRVTRILSQLSSDSHAETWSSYGYLKSVIEVEQSEIDYDAFLLVYTRASDLRRVSTIEDSSGAWEIKHMEIGSLEVAVVENSL